MFPNMEYIKTLVNGLKTAANKRFLNLEKWAEEAKAMLSFLWSNRTHYDTREAKKVVIEWDGNTEGKLTAVQANGITWVKVSDKTPTVEQLNDGAVMVCDVLDESGSLVATPVVLGTDGRVIVDNGFGVVGNILLGFRVVYTPDDLFTESGTWFLDALTTRGARGKCLTYTEGELKPLEQKYVPNADWNAAEGETGHVLNRTHYVHDELLGSAECPGVVSGTNTYIGKIELSKEINILSPPTIAVVFNGVRYEFKEPTRYRLDTNTSLYTYGYRTGTYDGPDLESEYPFSIFASYYYPNSHLFSTFNLYAKEPGSLQVYETSIVPLGRKFLSNAIPIINTEGTGEAYTATHDGIKSLETGMLITMIPHVVSTLTSPTLNINDLGAKSIKRRISSSGTIQNLLNVNSLKANVPWRLMYDGTYWIALDMSKPNTQDFYGYTPVSFGGTGRGELTSGRYLVGNGIQQVSLKTPSEVLEDIGAVPKPVTATVGQILAVKAVDDAGVPTEWEVVDPMVVASSTEGSTKKFRITVDDAGALTATEVTE